MAAAVKEQNRRAKLKRLSGLLGTIKVGERQIQEGNLQDLKRARWLEGMGDRNED